MNFGETETAQALLGRWAPLAVILGAAAGGVLIESVILRAFYRKAKRRQWTVLEVALEATRGIVVLLSAAIGIFAALVLFPLRSNEEFVANRALVVLIIWSVTVFAARVAVRLVENYNESQQHMEKTASLFTTLTGIGVYSTGVLVVLRYLGLSITPILGALGVGGLAVALALRDTLANFFSGLQLVASRRIRVGDFVRIDSGREGVVHDITWLHTTIREPNNSLVIVPNEKIAEAAFTNFSLPSDRTLVSAGVNLAYGTDLSLAETLAFEVAVSVERDFAPGAPPPSIRFTSAQESGLTLTAFLHVHQYGDHLEVRHEFYKRLLSRYEREGISVARQPWASAKTEGAALGDLLPQHEKRPTSLP